MNGVMNYNWLGVAFVSDDLPPEIHRKVEKKWICWRCRSIRNLTDGLMKMGWKEPWASLSNGI